MNRLDLKAIERYAEEQMAKLGLHGWPHVMRVQRLCVHLAKSVKDADIENLNVAALLHDVGKHVEKESDALDHGKISAEMAEQFLHSMKFDEDRVRQICHAIRVHTHGEEPHSIEAKLLHDADFLDKMGAVGIATVFIKACLTDTTIEEAAQFWRHPSKDTYVGRHMLWLSEPHFYTKKANSLAKRRNRVAHDFFRHLRDEITLADTRA
jgi:putative nucleotidyltransferase with HDIG domain